MTGPAGVRCSALGKRYGRRDALVGLDLVVRPGEVVGYLGPNGAGKTTTLRLLTGALRPTTGGATVAGHSCWRAGPAAHRLVGYLPAEPVFERRLDGRAVLAGAARASGRPPRQAAAVQERMAGRLGLDLRRPTGQLSRGNRQKLAVVRALWHAPAVLLLDEPSTGLDPLVREVLRELVREAADGGAAVLLSSHDLDQVSALADRVVVLRSGRVVADRGAADVTGLAPRVVTVTFARAADEAVLADVPALRIQATTGRTVRCSVPAPSLDILVKRLGAVHLEDLRVGAGDVEDWFRELYRAPGQRRSAGLAAVPAVEAAAEAQP
jgi:ABC-2 type transport system ATP-binding protein